MYKQKDLIFLHFRKNNCKCHYIGHSKIITIFCPQFLQVINCKVHITKDLEKLSVSPSFVESKKKKHPVVTILYERKLIHGTQFLLLNIGGTHKSWAPYIFTSHRFDTVQENRVLLYYTYLDFRKIDISLMYKRFYTWSSHTITTLVFTGAKIYNT